MRVPYMGVGWLVINLGIPRYAAFRVEFSVQAELEAMKSEASWRFQSITSPPIVLLNELVIPGYYSRNWYRWLNSSHMFMYMHLTYSTGFLRNLEWSEIGQFLHEALKRGF